VRKKGIIFGMLAVLLLLACSLAFAGGKGEAAPGKKAYTVAFANV